ASMQRKWSKLSFAIETGTPIDQVDSFLGDKEDRVSFIKAMNAIALKLAPGTLQALEQAGVFKNLPATAHILDIGGASGTYTEAFLRHLPSSTATIFDLPQGISQAKKRFQNSDLENRVELVEGDFTKQGFQGSFDLAFISAIIHQLDSLGCRDLFSKAWAALKPKGLVVVRDFVMREDRIFPEAGALFGVNMLVATESGCVYTFCEIKADLEAAGFKKVELAVDTPNMSAIVTALK
ncbi:MAG: methyltransferase domain-containing protein, partial [Desulfovibrionaceae bacterium]|nr:methyltransferase domain-containing protein [Desulfovibrionaceae bacterium]